MKTNMKRLLALILALSMVMSLLSANVWAADSSGDASGASVASGDVSVQEEASGEGSDSSADGSESKTEDASASDTAEAEEDESKEDQSEPGEEESAPENQSDAEAEDDDEPKEDESEEEVSPEEEVTVQETVSNISYLEGKYENNTLTFTEKTASSCTVVESSTTTWSSGWYVVNTPSTDNLTISSRITISGTVNLILCDGAKLIAQKGITTTGATLNIYAQSDGSGVLYAGTTDGSNQTCGDSVAGIGGNGNNFDGGSVNIHGGKVIARGGNGRNGGAGIGGGACGAGGGVIIYGGNVTATGGGKTFGAAGIGGGGCGDGDRTGTGGNVSIYGGTVTATGAPDSGMGIGKGEGADGSNNGKLTLGANVKLQVSTSNSNWRDSDGGVYDRARYMRAFYTPPVSYMAWDSDQNKLVKKTGDNACSTYTTVTASTTTFENNTWYVVDGTVNNGNRITVNGTAHLILKDNATLNATQGITTTGATLNIYEGWTGTRAESPTVGALNATSGSSDWGAAAIGGGNGSAGGTVTINGGTVTATGKGSGAGIGGGKAGAGGKVTIKGGTVTANGGDCGAGIGGGAGNNGAGGEVTIKGGTVTANGGGDGGAGIGGGGDEEGTGGVGGKVTIEGGTVTANGSNCGAGIGGGDGAAGGEVTIKGGTVTANGSNGGAGIGGGYGGNGGNVTIYGGTVTATGGKLNWSEDYGFGIGRGYTGGSDGTLIPGTGLKLETSSNGTSWTNTTSTPDTRTRYMRAYYAPAVTYQVATATGSAVTYTTATTTDYNLVTASASAVTWGAASAETWYVVNNSVEIKGRITVNGTVNLILLDGAKLTASKGITTTGATLNIYEGWTGDRAETHTVGELVATGAANYNAGIGGLGSEEYDGGAGGTVNIHGGTVTATGHHVTGSGGAGIGGGFSEARTGGAGGTVTIYSGTVTATGGYNAAGIGGGDGNTGGAGGTVTIYGGTVTATGKSGGAGIGGGSNASDNGTLTLGRGVTMYGDDSPLSDPPAEDKKIESTVGENVTTRYRYMKNTYDPHTHDFTYSASGATITATCAATDCDLPVVNTKPTATLTINAPEHTAVGDGKSAEATLTDLNGIQGKAAVSYYNANADGTDKDGAALTAAPTDGGRYWAEITLTNADNGSTATAHVVYTVANPAYTITLPTGLEHGTVTADKTKAKYGEEVALTVTPESDEYICRTLTVTDADSGDVTVTDNKFTMPASPVTVSASFEQKTRAAVALTVNQVNEKGGTACLLKEDFAPLGESAQVREGDRFILCVTKEEEYDFTTAFSPDAVKEEFSKEDYEGYLAYANSEEIAVSPGMVLYWVTMPCVESGSLSATVTFIEPKTYTILYQPQSGTSPDMVFCKIGTEQQGEVVKFGRMRSGAKMGSDTVWTMTITSMVQPTKLAFIGSNSAATDEEKTALANSVKDAAMSNAVLSQTANPSWTDAAGGKYLLIGGNAKVVTAVFVSDPNAISTFKDNAFDEAEATEGVSYQFAVVTDGSGTVTAPAAPARDGYTFGGWRGVENQKEEVYEAGDSVSISENTTFNAVWMPVTPSVTLNLNGGTGVSTSQTVGYNATLSLETPTRSGYAFDRWTVSEAVTESGTYFAKGSTFDFSKPITENLKLTAQWKHVHSYKCYKISVFGDKLAKYQKYEDVVHVAICDCKDIQLTAHEFDSSGKCKCGYTKPGTQDVTMNVSYGQWSNNQYTEKMKGMPETAKDGQEVSICAPGYWGDLEFSKWQYSTNGTDWYDLTADAYASFLIPCSLSVRALYINPVRDPTVELISRHYDDHAEINGQTWTMDNILYQMNYKLPDGCTFVDGGIKLGDNGGISYYFIQQVRMSYDNESKGIIAGMAAGMAGLGVLANALGGSGDPVGVIIDFATADYEEYRINYLETEDNVLDKMLTPKALAKQMYEGKPVNVEKYPPIYWEARVPTKGMSGSITTAPPLRFAQKNNQEHYIYGIAWMRYKQGGKIKTIYTDAIAPTAKNPTASASKRAQ